MNGEDFEGVAASEELVYESSEYSDGETSEDLVKTPPTRPKSISPDIFQPDENLLYLFNTMDTSFIIDSDIPVYPLDNSIIYNTIVYDSPPEDNSPNVPHPIDNAIVVVSTPRYFSSLGTVYLENKQIVYGWNDVKDFTATEFLNLMKNTYKILYSSLRSQIRFHLFSPQPMLDLSVFRKTRKEFQNGNILFHYIGYGFPPPDSDYLYYQVNQSHVLHKYALVDIVNALSFPATFIFDCDNSAAVIKTITSLAKSMKTATSFICFGATSEGEHLPPNPLLPKDFLSMCFLSPLTIALLCHILENYKTKYVSPQFPLDILNTLLLYEQNVEQIKLLSVLHSTTQAIAASVLSLEKFYCLFRQDQTISSLFSRFILAEFLLSRHNVYPVSYPMIPKTYSNSLWHHWTNELDSWLITKTASSPYYSRALSTFSIKLAAKQDIGIDLLTVVASIPQFGLNLGESPIILLAHFASLSAENRHIIASIVPFTSYLVKLLDRVLHPGEYDALCYLILAMLQHKPSLSMIPRQSVASLSDLIFHPKIGRFSRSMLASIATCLVETDVPLQASIASDTFVSSIFSELPQMTPSELLWCLLLIKKTMATATKSLVQKRYNPLIFLPLLFHPSSECRAAALNIMTEALPDSIYVFLGSLVVLTDMSHIVRYELAMYIKRFISDHHSSTNPKDRVLSNFGEFLALAYNDYIKWSLKDCFLKFPKWVASAATNRRDVMDIAHYVRDCLESDPINTIVDVIQRTKPPSQSDAVFCTSISKLVDIAEWKSPTEPVMKKSDSAARDIVIPRSEIRLVGEFSIGSHTPSYIKFSPLDGSISIATEENWVFSVDTAQKVTFMTMARRGRITDLQNIGTHTLIAEDDGCIQLWSHKSHNPSVSFRADLDYKSKSGEQKAVVSALRTHIATSMKCGGVSLWDINTMQLVSEWFPQGSSQVSAMNYHPVSNTELLVGYNNGSIYALDLRDPYNINEIGHSVLSGRIINIAGCQYGKQLMYAASNDGQYLSWNSATHKTDSFLKTKHPVKSFDVHTTYPLISMSPVDLHPVITTPSGEILHRISDVTTNSVVAMHSSLPILACGCSNGTIRIYQIAFGYI